MNIVGFRAIEIAAALALAVGFARWIRGVTRRFSIAPSVQVHVTTNRTPPTAGTLASTPLTSVPGAPAVSVKRTVYKIDVRPGATPEIPKEMLDALSPAQRQLVLEKIAEAERSASTGTTGTTGTAKPKA